MNIPSDNYESGVCRIEKLEPILDRWEFQGTGFLYENDNRILTNTHVIPQLGINFYDYRAVFMVNGVEQVRTLTNWNPFAGGLILGTVPHLFVLPNSPRLRVDVCSSVLNAAVTDAHIFRAVDLHEFISNPQDHCKVTVFHYPRGDPMTLSPLHELYPLVPNPNPSHFWYRAQPPTQLGSSGAPLVLHDGRVCGVNFAGDGTDSIAVPMRNIMELQHIQQLHNVETENLLRFGHN